MYPNILFLIRSLTIGLLLLFMVILFGANLDSEVNAKLIRETDATINFGRRVDQSKETSEKVLWVDAIKGDNNNDGLSSTTALKTIQRAADLAQPSMTVHIQPGIYRESIIPAQSGTAAGTIRYVAEGGPGTAVIRGSEPSSDLAWTQLITNVIGLPPKVDPTNIYYADLSSWNLINSPRLVVELGSNGQVADRLPLAREPDWSVGADWKYHEFWWAADGGNGESECYPPTDPDPYKCDWASRSLNQLTDLHDDVDPTGVEPGNLTTLGNLTGATIFVLDTDVGGYIFHRTIIGHDMAAGRITVDQNCEQGYGTGQPGLGWGSKYYLEGLPQLLDSPGEWWYDQKNGRLYLWPLHSGNPATMNIEISRREDGFIIRNRSYITLDGLAIEFFNNNAIYARNSAYDKSYNDIIRNAILRYDDNGVWLTQWVDSTVSSESAIKGFVMENSEIAFMDTRALTIAYGWGESSEAASFTRPGVLNTVVRHNEFHHLGFRPDDEDDVGVLIVFPDHLRFEENFIHHVANNGAQFMRSVVQSNKEYGFSPDEIKTGFILIRDNVFEKACQNHTDCGALMISGSTPDRHVFRDLLMTGNVLRDTYGWSYISQERGNFDGGGSSSEVQGMGGFGLYVNNASGIYAYRNIAYNNAFAGFKFAVAWRDGDIIFYNNTTANSLNGFHFGGWQYDTHNGSFYTQIANNIIVNNESYGIILSDGDGFFENTTIDHNLYFNNGWRPDDQGGMWKAGDMRLNIPKGDLYYQTIQEIRLSFGWEEDGVEGNPAFWDYNVNDHGLFDGSWPDFHLTSTSTNAIDRGIIGLPNSLSTLLVKFGVYDSNWGTAYDIGRYEAGFEIRSNPDVSFLEPGGVTRYYLNLYPLDLSHEVTLTVSSSIPSLAISIEPDVIDKGTTATLTVADNHAGPGIMPGLWYGIQVHGNGGGFASDRLVRLLVGGSQLYLPMLANQFNP